MTEYYILTLDPNAGHVIQWVLNHKLRFEAHLNRTRFWVPEGPLYTEFTLRFADSCPRVDPECDLITGLPKQ